MSIRRPWRDKILTVLGHPPEREIALRALSSYTAAKAGFPRDGEVDDPNGILVSGLIGVALGYDLERKHHCERAEPTTLRYSLSDGARILCIIAQLGSGYGAFSPEQAETEPPRYGFHDDWWDAEAEAVSRLLYTPPNPSQD